MFTYGACMWLEMCCPLSDCDQQYTLWMCVNRIGQLVEVMGQIKAEQEENDSFLSDAYSR